LTHLDRDGGFKADRFQTSRNLPFPPSLASILNFFLLLLPYTNPGPLFPFVLIFPRLPPSQSGVIFSIKYFSPLDATTTPSRNRSLLSAGGAGIEIGTRFADEEEDEEEEEEEEEE